MASGKTLKKRNACLHAVRQAVGKKIACLNGLRSEGVNEGIWACRIAPPKFKILYFYQYKCEGKNLQMTNIHVCSSRHTLLYTMDL